MRHLYICMLLACTGCATTLSKEALKVRYLTKSDPPASCQEIGIVRSASPFDLTPEAKINRLRENAAEKGGNTVRLDIKDASGNLEGTAFKC